MLRFKLDQFLDVQYRTLSVCECYNSWKLDFPFNSLSFSSEHEEFVLNEKRFLIAQKVAHGSPPKQTLQFWHNDETFVLIKKEKKTGRFYFSTTGL